MSIDSSLRTFLDAQTTAGRRVYVGQRLQSAALPALTISVNESQRVTLGVGSTVGLVRYAYTLNAIDSTMGGAMALADQAATVLQTTYAASSVACLRTSEPQLQDPSPGEGDEIEPVIASVTLETYLPE